MIIRNSTSLRTMDGTSTISTDESAVSDSRITALESAITDLSLTNDLIDVAASGAPDGSYLVYDNSTGLWTASTGPTAELLEKVNVVDQSAIIQVYPTNTTFEHVDTGETMFLGVNNITASEYNSTAVDQTLPECTTDDQMLAAVAIPDQITGNPGYINCVAVAQVRKSAGASGDSARLYFTISRLQGVVETLMGTSETTADITSPDYHTVFANCVLTTPDDFQNTGTTNFVLIRIYCTAVLGSPEYQIQFGGTSPARINLPVSAQNIVFPAPALQTANDIGLTYEGGTPGFTGHLAALSAYDTVLTALQTLDALTVGAVDSVNGETGVVVLDTDDISEGSTNQYYTDARVQAISINELSEDTTPALGGNLDTAGFNIAGAGNLTLTGASAHSMYRRTNNDNNAVLVVGKDTTTTGNSVLLKSVLLFTAKNSTAENSIGSVWGEKTDATTGKQVTLSLYADDGTNRVDFLSANRNSSGVDTVNVLKPLTVTGTGTFSSALFVNVDRTTTTAPNSVLMTTKLPSTVDIVNYFTGVADYSATTLPASDIQSTVTFRILLPGETTSIIPARMVNTWNDTTSTSEMQLRAYLVDGTEDYEKLTVSKNNAGSSVPFQFPAYTTTERDALTPSTGWVLFNTTTDTLQVYTSTGWEDLN